MEKALEAGLLKESINSFLSSVSRSDCTLFLGLCYYGLTIRELAGKLLEAPVRPGRVLLPPVMQNHPVKKEAAPACAMSAGTGAVFIF